MHILASLITGLEKGLEQWNGQWNGQWDVQLVALLHTVFWDFSLQIFN